MTGANLTNLDAVSLDLQQATIIPTPNKKFRIYITHSAEHGSIILKQFAPLSGYSAWRQFELLIRQHINNYADSALKNSALYRQRGIATPLAVIPQVSGHQQDLRGKLVGFKKIEGAQTAKQIFLDLQNEKNPRAQAFLRKLIISVGTLAAQIHKEFLLHGDLTLNNILLSFPGSYQPDSLEEDTNYNIHIVDLDHAGSFSPLNFYQRYFGKYNCIHRIELQNDWEDLFLKTYLAGACSKWNLWAYKIHRQNRLKVLRKILARLF